MRQETNNEIDLLLRRLSRRQEVPVSDGDSRIDSDHLDADELNAFAENVLPAAARARYTEHLADCSKCREIVVQLSASVPMAVKETVTAAAPSGLRQFLASFFSPMVLRYAVPALGLIVVAAIGFVVFQSNRSPATVAQLERQVQSPAPNPSTQQAPSVVFHNSDGPPKESSSSPSARPSTGETVSDEPPPPSATTQGDLTSAKTDASAQKTAQPAVANEAAAPPQPTPTPAATVDEMRVDVQGRRNEQIRGAQARDLAKAKTAEGVQEQQKKSEDPQSARERSAPKPAAGDARAQREPSTSTYLGVGEAEKDRADGTIRSVAGRRFRKQGGVWVDTAYTSGSAIVNIARGSEQYRALVADEPDIKKIADELDGPIVVVWKSRTYRIR